MTFHYSVLLGVHVFLCFCFVRNLCSFKQFDDSILFRLEWPGDAAMPDDLFRKFNDKSVPSDEAVVISSVDNEKYVCSLPKESSSTKHKRVEYFGPTPHQLVKPLYDQRSCTYRIEVYWTYELCHGQYILQYHEEKDNHRRASRQEYYLGQYIPELDSSVDKSVDYNNPPKRKVEDQMLPYYAVNYTQGTLCDISQKLRTTEVHYVCDPEGKNQIYSLDEISSCEYQVVVLTPRLCNHPGFKTEKQRESTVECYPLTGSPPKPTSLTVWEHEVNWEERATQKNIILPVVPREEPHPSSSSQEAHAKQSASPPSATPQKAPSDLSLEQAFLSGEYCLYGGVGWWKHEYCHRKQVLQYHEDPDVGRTEILLGTWDEEEHLKWIKTKPHKRPVRIDGQVRQTNHLYTNGDVCDVTGKPRTVEVRLMCKETPLNPDSVTLYLLEPKSCEYILGVESQMFCDIFVNEDGLFLEKPQ